MKMIITQLLCALFGWAQEGFGGRSRRVNHIDGKTLAFNALIGVKRIIELVSGGWRNESL